MLSLNAHLWGSIFTIATYGSPGQKQQYLPKLLSGEIIGGHAITDGDNATSSFEPSESSCTVSFHKRYIPNAPIADILIVYTPHQNNFIPLIIERNDSNIIFNDKHQTFGFERSPIGEIIAVNAKLNKNRILGENLDIYGKAVSQKILELERSFIFTGINTIMRNKLSLLFNYCRNKTLGETSLIEKQAISHKLADIASRLHIIDTLIDDCANRLDNQQSITLPSSIIKLYAGEEILKSCNDMIQIMGAQGIEKEKNHLINFTLDALASRLIAGTSEIQKEIIVNLWS